MAKFETIFAEWAKYAVSEGLDKYKISEIRAEMYTSVKFLKFHDNIIICPIDKSKDICIFEVNVYISELNEVFEPSKFKKLKRNL